MTLNSDAKFEEKLTVGSKNDMRNLVSFNVSSGKSEKLHLEKKAHQISIFWAFHYLSEVVQIPVIFETTSRQLLYKLCNIL